MSLSRRASFLLAALVLSAPLLSAQTAAPASPSTGSAASAPTGPAALPLFRATLPGGVYEVAVGRIVAVTSHEYIVDAVARVYEVNVDTAGSLLARFYYLEANTPNLPGGVGAGAAEKAQELFTQAADRTGQDAWKKVVKNYPVTTHARTVEYRLQTRDDLNKIFAAAEEAFRLQKAKTVTIQ